MQGKFWEMHDLLYENQQHLEDDGPARDTPSGSGSTSTGSTRSSPSTYAERVHEDFMSGVRSGVNGTPTFYINGARHDDSYDQETLFDTMERAASAR